MNNIEKLALALAIFVILAGVFLAVNEYVKTIDITQVPLFLQPIVKAMQNFFAYSAVVFAVAYLRNTLGYLRNWVTEHKTQTVDYDLNRYYSTLLYYVGPFNIALSALPAPYNIFAAGLTFVVDVFVSEYKKIMPAPLASSLVAKGSIT